MMIVRKPGETFSQHAIRAAWETGHFWTKENPEGANISQNDLKLLGPDDDVVIRAMVSMSRMDSTLYSKHVFEKHNRAPMFDGVMGPAMQAMLEDPIGRCPIPDFAPPPNVSFLYDDPLLQEVVERMQLTEAMATEAPAIGTGNWKSCHNIGQFHCAAIRVNAAGMPAHVAPHFKTILTRVQKAYADIGLLFVFVDMNKVDILSGLQWQSNINSEMSFVSNSNGWIGLAIVGTNEGCQSNIWCKFLASYKGGSSQESVITQWVTLIMHELAHNCGRSHTNGGVMNPSIVNNLPGTWPIGDPSTAWMKIRFGGIYVPIPGGLPPIVVPPDNPPIGSIEQQLAALRAEIADMRLKNIYQDAMIQGLLQKINSHAHSQN